MRPFTPSIVVLLLGIPACNLSSPRVDLGGPDAAPERIVAADIPFEINRDLDLLFVVDNSGSMGEEQASLATNFPRFLNVLTNVPGGLPNLHLGVISSNVGVGPYTITACGGDGDNGRLQNWPHGACQGPSDYWIEDVLPPGATDRLQNYSGSLSETFACIAKLGTTGCGLEQHLESLQRALDGTNPENEGFLRDSAHLGVVILADEDDCSAADPAVFDPSQTNVSDPLGPLSSFRCSEFGVVCDGGPIARSPADYQSCEPRADSYLRHPKVYADFLRSRKADPDLIMVSGIFGNPAPFGVGLDQDSKPELLPSCETGAGKAAPGVRLKAFLDEFPEHNAFASICNEDLTDALVQIAESMRKVIGNPCLQGDIDSTDHDPTAPGRQLDCQVSDVRHNEEGTELTTTMPACALAADGQSPAEGGVRPCWYAELDQLGCAGTPTQQKLGVERVAAPPPGTHIVARCALR